MSQSPIALIAFDLDGTVFSSPTNQVVSPRVCAAFQAAHDAGALITVASGRPFWMLGTQIPAAPWLDFAISCNGARVAGTHRSDLELPARARRGHPSLDRRARRHREHPHRRRVAYGDAPLHAPARRL